MDKSNEQVDVKIDGGDKKFKFRVASIIIKDNKVLMVEMNNNGFLCCPGGHVELGEDTISAVKRETFEEIGILCDKVKLVAIIENFFTSKVGKRYHELGFYYLLENPNIPVEKLQDYKCVENDHGKEVLLDFKWIDLDEMASCDIRPLNIKQQLSNKDFNFKHFILQTT